MRTQARERMWQLNAMTCVQNPGKKGEHHKSVMNQINVWIPYAEIKQSMGSGSDFARAIKK